ncbi:MAG: hypothetical protein FJX78_05985 [Armatimonadetes bacterium]|nr:hypothetical protein [Armatimonadota bacterium]
MTDAKLLTFAELRAANRARINDFKTPQGTPIDHSRWGLSQWSNAVAGEVGEACSLVKKLERGDFSLVEARELLAAECADVVTYLDILADVAGIDLAAAIVKKFNTVSERIDSQTRLRSEAQKDPQARPTTWTEPGGCSSCDFCGIEPTDMNPYCTHPLVLQVHPHGLNLNVALREFCGHDLYRARAVMTALDSLDG